MRRRLTTLLIGAALVAPAAAGAAPFHPRIGHAFGLMPRTGASFTPEPAAMRVVYHGGTVMRGVTIHPLFWAPAGHAFSGSPGPGIPGYAALLEQFLTDAAGASATSGNVYSLLREYPDRTGAGEYRISVAPPVTATDAFPRGGCASPSGSASCVTDVAVERELAAHAGKAVGLHDVWIAFLPPGVDECISAGSCATTDYAGYHSVFDTARGPVVYAVIPDPTLEQVPPPGSDPEGNPTAESAIDTVAHELFESITNPEGAGWMDSNGYEVADKCETGPQIGQPLGYAPDGSPYNQLIGGHQYLIQSMWSNHDLGCVLASTASGSDVLPEVALTQWSPTLRGTDPEGRSGQAVRAALLRAGVRVATATGRLGSGGRFTLELRGRGGRLLGVGDDREELDVVLPGRRLIIDTGNGGNPFTQSGWTGWYVLDTGYAVGSRSVGLAPCSQVGVLTLSVDGRPTGAPLDQCSTTSGIATLPTPQLNARTMLSLTSLDNRATSASAPAGALIGLTVRLGEPGAGPVGTNDQVKLEESGAATCAADLYWARVRCAGLVPGERYRLGPTAAARAGEDGVAHFSRLRLARGGALALRGAGGRVLSVLHIADLRADLTGGRTVATGGSCDAGAFVGPGLSAPPVSPAVGEGVTGDGRICVDGQAAGLPVGDLSELDDRSGGQTSTEVPAISGTIPADDATLYGPFRALARATLPAPNGGAYGVRDPVSLALYRAGGRRPLRRLTNVDTAVGASVARLGSGTYTAVWTLRDRNGDTRTLRTTFVEAP